jgi:hypothetical protein
MTKQILTSKYQITTTWKVIKKKVNRNHKNYTIESITTDCKNVGNQHTVVDDFNTIADNIHNGIKVK